MKLFNIISDINGHLIIVQQPQPGDYSYLVAVAIFLIILACYKRAWGLLIGPVFIAYLLYTAHRVGGQSTYRAEIIPETHQIISEQMDKGKLTAKTIVPINDIASAEMQSNRGATRIALIMRDGTVMLPLGPIALQDEPDQYVALTAIRQVVAQNAAAAQ